MIREPEVLDADEDNGTMSANVAELASAVVGRRILSAETTTGTDGDVTTLTLDDGTRVKLHDSFDCCAFTIVRDFFLDPRSVDHIILGVSTSEKFTEWHVYADLGDILRLSVGWSAGNPFYYGYGFTIVVEPDDAR